MTLGALLAETPHTRPIQVSGTATELDLEDRLKLEPSTYEGPTGIVGVLLDACARLDVPAVSFWAAVPHYLPQPPCPKATLALLGQVEDLLEISIPMGDLPEDARAWERGVAELAEEDEDVGEYVREARGEPGHRRAPRGQRRGDRQGVRAVSQAAGRGRGVGGAGYHGPVVSSHFPSAAALGKLPNTTGPWCSWCR